MKLLTFKSENQLKIGIKTDNGIIDVEATHKHLNRNKMPLTIQDIITNGHDGLLRLESIIKNNINTSVIFDEDDITFGPCVPNPGKIICIGLNYQEHANEANVATPESPILFSKFNNAISAHKETITIPKHTNKVDYEGELAIVIGKRAKNICKEEALDYVFGYCIGNDVSARDLQFLTSQWLLGKSIDGFMPVGPYLVTKDEIENPNNLKLTTTVNGEIRQESNTRHMIFPCDEIISYISNHITLEPGDIILTGTPEGVILGYPEDQRVWLKHNDEVTISIDQLGSLTNRFESNT